MKSDDRREPLFDAAESQTPSMCGNSLRGNRETLETPTSRGGVGRSGKACAVARHARLQGVGRSHSTEEAGEQGRPEGGSGVRGGKGIDQGKHPANPTRAGHSAGKSVESDRWVYERWRRGASAVSLVVITRGKSRMR
jgi:hypothetical protein